MFRYTPKESVFFRLLIALLTFSITCLFIKLSYYLMGAWRFGVLAFLVIFAYHFYKKVAIHWKPLLLGIVLAVLFASIYWIIDIIQSNISNPHEWDFFEFWLSTDHCVPHLHSFALPKYSQSVFLDAFFRIRFVFYLYRGCKWFM